MNFESPKRKLTWKFEYPKSRRDFARISTNFKCETRIKTPHEINMVEKIMLASTIKRLLDELRQSKTVRKQQIVNSLGSIKC